MEPARIYGILAPEANKVVLFRRGPSKLTLQLVWDLETDEITPGQWIKGKVFVERSDVSPDGRYLIAAISNYGENSHHAEDLNFWTAISRPPYFTAIAMWGSAGSYLGGGMWESNRKVRLNNDPHAWEETLPVQLPVQADLFNEKVVEPFMMANNLVYIERTLLEKRGWIRSDILDPTIKERIKEMEVDYQGVIEAYGLNFADIETSAARWLVSPTYHKIFKLGEVQLAVKGKRRHWQMFDQDGSLVRKWTTPSDQPFWLELDNKGNPIFSEKGCLYRWTGFPHGEPTLVADLNHYTFEPVAPPAWATKW